MSNTIRNTLIGASAALTTAFTPMAHAEEAPKEPVQMAQLGGSTQQVNFANAAQGKPVTMTFGSHYDEIDVRHVQVMLDERCDLNVKWEPGYENGILVESNGKKSPCI